MIRQRRLFTLLGAAIVGVSCHARDSADGSVISGESVLSLDSLRCVQTDAAHRCALYGVSIYELLTQPREWHGRRVQAIGYAHFHDEENLLYASAEDWRRNISANAVRVPPPAADRDSLNHRDIEVEATFDARSGGGLQDVTRMESWQPMARPRWEDIPKIDLRPPPD